VIRSEADIDRLQIPSVTVDWAGTRARHATLAEVFDGVLPVVTAGRATHGIAPLDHYAALRGIDQLFLDLVDHPAMVHKAVGRLVDGHIAIVRALEREGALSLAHGRHYTGSGGTAYTSQLPSPGYDGTRVRPIDQWGFATAQIFSEVSPAMHEEFALRHEKRFLELFGLNCYGCCEPLHRKIDILRRVPRLRRISMSPFVDIDVGAEAIGQDFIYSAKPNPAVLAGERWHPDAARADLQGILEKTRGLHVEVILKDIHTVRGEARRLAEWAQIAMELVQES